MVIELNPKMLDRILEFFPFSDKIKEIRPEQEAGLLQIVEALKSGHTRIVFSGPTGIGKSAIIATLARMFKAMSLKSTVTSPLNTLVDQFDDSYGKYARTLKGKDNYNCECAKRIGKSIGCSDGYCVSKKCGTQYVENTKTAIERGLKTIIHHPMTCEGCQLNCICKQCPYKLARQAYIDASIGNTNYTMFLIGMREADVCFIDECQAARQFIRLSYKITLHEEWPEGLSWQSYLMLLVETLAEKKQLLEKREQLLQDVNNENDRLVIARANKQVERDINNIERIVSDYSINKEPWVPIFSTQEDRKTRGLIHSVTFEPITTDRHEIGIYKPDQIVFYFSATPTIPRSADGTPWHLIECESPFPAITRPWAFVPIHSMSKKNRAVGIPKIAAYINDLRKKRPGKILVHCHSYEIAKAVGECCERLGHPAVIIQARGSSVYDEEGNEIPTRNLALEKFLISSNANTVFFSVNFWEGVDLWEWEGKRAVFTNLIIKIPFDNPTDPVIIAMKRVKGEARAEEELNEAIAARVTQGYGRTARNMQKFEIAKKQVLTLILDTDWNGVNTNFYSENKHMFRKYMREAEIHRTEINWNGEKNVNC